MSEAGGIREGHAGDTETRTRTHPRPYTFTHPHTPRGLLIQGLKASACRMVALAQSGARQGHDAWVRVLWEKQRHNHPHPHTDTGWGRSRGSRQVSRQGCEGGLAQALA